MIPVIFDKVKGQWRIRHLKSLNAHKNNVMCSSQIVIRIMFTHGLTMKHMKQLTQCKDNSPRTLLFICPFLILFLRFLFWFIFWYMFTECPYGFYGHDCKESCSTHCIVSGTCDRVTGQCIGGCKAGWKESKCDTSTDISLFIKKWNKQF